ncbi:MAG: hypothetical protein AAF411_31075, partial [Myxococcota bacterium]
DWPRSLWNTAMFGGAIIIGPLFFAWSASGEYSGRWSHDQLERLGANAAFVRRTRAVVSALKSPAQIARSPAISKPHS